MEGFICTGFVRIIKIFARTINDFPHRSLQAAAIMLMLSNNLDEAVAQHPYETYYSMVAMELFSKLGSVLACNEIPC